MSCQEFLLKDHLLSLWGSPCVLFIVYSLFILKFALCVSSLSVWLVCFWGILPWVYPVWDSLGFLDLGDYFLPHFREVLNYYLPKYFLMVFLSVFFFWDSNDSNFRVFNTVLEVSEIVLISFNSFLFFPLWFIYF